MRGLLFGNDDVVESTLFIIKLHKSKLIFIVSYNLSFEWRNIIVLFWNLFIVLIFFLILRRNLGHHHWMNVIRGWGLRFISVWPFSVFQLLNNVWKTEDSFLLVRLMQLQLLKYIFFWIYLAFSILNMLIIKVVGNYIIRKLCSKERCLVWGYGRA